VTFDVATSNGSATSGSDYVALALTGQTIAAGATSKTFVVTLNGDSVYEPDETFNVTLSNVSGANLADFIGVGTIANDDVCAPDPVDRRRHDYRRQQRHEARDFHRDAFVGADRAVFFDAATADGTATAGSDYVAKVLTGQRIVVAPRARPSRSPSTATRRTKRTRPSRST
jgi:hypothetical protein